MFKYIKKIIRQPNGFGLESFHFTVGTMNKVNPVLNDLEMYFQYLISL